MIHQTKSVKVWDPLIRIGHWILVIAFFTAYFTEDDLITVHVWAGYVVGVYLIVRLLWGFIGGKYARFSSFVCTPAKVISSLKTLFALKPQHYIGHNPVGGIMVIVLLFCLAGTTLTGLKLYAVEDNKGPFAVSAGQSPVSFKLASLVAEAKAEDHDDEDREASKEVKSERKADKEAEEFWEEWHELFANLTLFLVFLHIAGVFFSSKVDKEKLVKAMLTGRKDIDETYQ